MPVAPTVSIWAGVAGLVGVPGGGHGLQLLFGRGLVKDRCVSWGSVLNKLRSKGAVVVVGYRGEVLSTSHGLGEIVLGDASTVHGDVAACGKGGVIDGVVVLTSAWTELADIGVERLVLHHGRGSRRASEHRD